MTEAAMKLEGVIVQGLYESFWDSCQDRTYAGVGTFEIVTDEELEALGEDPAADDCPLFLKNKATGTIFEVDLDATVRETSPEQRQRERAQAIRLRDETRAYLDRSGRPAESPAGIEPATHPL